MASHKKQFNSLAGVRFFPEKSTKSTTTKAKSPVILPVHRQNCSQGAVLNANIQNKPKPISKGLQRCESMGEEPASLAQNAPLHSALKELLNIENDIAHTELETISIEKLLHWSKALAEQCKILEQNANFNEQKPIQQIMLPQHQYAFKIIHESDILERQIADEIQNRKKLEEQTSQMIKSQEQEINQLLLKIKSLESMIQ